MDQKDKEKLAELNRQFGISTNIIESMTEEQFEKSGEFKELVDYYSNVMLLWHSEVPVEIKNPIFSHEQKNGLKTLLLTKLEMLFPVVSNIVL